MTRDDEPDWEPEDDDLPDDDYQDDDDETDTVPCPYCREPVYDDAIYCPRCENYLSREDAPPKAKPVWLIVGVIACLVVVLLWIAPF